MSLESTMFMAGWFRDHFEEIAKKQAPKRFEHECSINRAYLLGVLGVSDQVSFEEAEVYIKATEGLEKVKVEIDITGELSGRDAPPEGHVFAVITEGPLFSKPTRDSDIFWDRLNDGLDALESAQQAGNLEQA